MRYPASEKLEIIRLVEQSSLPVKRTLALAWTSVWLIPQLFGVPLRTFALYQPDFVILLVATAATGVLWAVFRLGIFYSSNASSTT